MVPESNSLNHGNVILPVHKEGGGGTQMCQICLRLKKHWSLRTSFCSWLQLNASFVNVIQRCFQLHWANEKTLCVRVLCKVILQRFLLNPEEIMTQTALCFLSDCFLIDLSPKTALISASQWSVKCLQIGSSLNVILLFLACVKYPIFHESLLCDVISELCCSTYLNLLPVWSSSHQLDGTDSRDGLDPVQYRHWNGALPPAVSMCQGFSVGGDPQKTSFFLFFWLT